MTIESSVNDGITYSGNDSTTVFSFPFKVNLASQVEVIIRDALEAETTKVVDVDYTVTNQNVEGSGSLTYPISGDPLATGSKITITPVMDYKQSTDIRNQGRFAPTSHEQAFDTGMMHIKELKGLVDRAIKFKKSSNITGAEFDQDPEDNKILTWDGANGKIKNTSVSSLDVALISSFWEAVMGNADLSDSIAALGGATAFRAAIGIAPVTDFVKTILDDETAIEVRTTLGVTPATTSNAGVSLLHKQVTVVNGTDTDHDLTSTSGNFQFDDGTAQVQIGVLTKKIDATWVGGDNQGGMEETLNLTGTYTSSGVTVTGTSSVFTSEFTVGDVIYSTQEGIGRRITVITSDTTLTVSSAWGSNITGEAVKRNGLAPDTTYHYFQTHNPTTGISDFLFSTSVASPTFPSGYTKKKKLVSVLTDGAANIRKGTFTFNRDGSYKFKFDIVILDLIVAVPNTSIHDLTLTIPSGLVLQPIINFFYESGGTGGSDRIILFTSPNQTDTNPSASAFTGFISQGANEVEGANGYFDHIESNISSKIRYKSSVSSNISVINNGWIDNNL